MSIEIQVRGRTSEQLRDLAGASLKSTRENLVREAMIESLQKIVEQNPVRTGQARAAWVQSLEELGGTPPAGWEGPQPTGVETGRRLGTLSIDDGDEISRIEATNAVHYISYLEYGTSRMAPFAMVRSALLQLQTRLSQLFRW
jgi:hypothetical protein